MGSQCGGVCMCAWCVHAVVCAWVQLHRVYFLQCQVFFHVPSRANDLDMEREAIPANAATVALLWSSLGPHLICLDEPRTWKYFYKRYDRSADPDEHVVLTASKELWFELRLYKDLLAVRQLMMFVNSGHLPARLRAGCDPGQSVVRRKVTSGQM